MSHISQLTIRIRDLDALDAACKELGCELRRTQKTFTNFGGRTTKCDMAVCVTGAGSQTYEAGLIKQPDGTYAIQMDNWQGGYGLNAKIGNDAKKLLQMYGINAAQRQAVKQGMQTRRQSMPDGSIRLICEPKQQVAHAGQFAGSGF